MTTLTSGSSDFNLLPTYLYRYYAPWVQDDWRVSRRLTVNLGFRWDFNIPANERYNRMNRGFDLNLTNNVDQMIDQAILPRISQRILEQMAEGELPTRLTLGVDEAGDFSFGFTSD